MNYSSQACTALGCHRKELRVQVSGGGPSRILACDRSCSYGSAIHSCCDQTTAKHTEHLQQHPLAISHCISHNSSLNTEPVPELGTEHESEGMCMTLVRWAAHAASGVHHAPEEERAGAERGVQHRAVHRGFQGGWRLGGQHYCQHPQGEGCSTLWHGCARTCTFVPCLQVQEVHTAVGSTPSPASPECGAQCFLFFFSVIAWQDADFMCASPLQGALCAFPSARGGISMHHALPAFPAAVSFVTCPACYKMLRLVIAAVRSLSCFASTKTGLS